MALAFHILAHRAPSQVERLCRVLQHPDDLFVLHFDRRAPAALHALGRELARTRPNVIVQKSRRVLWGGPQIPDLKIEAMALALARSTAWTHFYQSQRPEFPRETTWRDRRSPRGPCFDSLCRLVRSFCHAIMAQYRPAFGSLAPSVALASPGFDDSGLGRCIRSVFHWENQLPYLALG